MFSRRTQIKLSKLLIIITSWILVSICAALYDYAAFRSEFSLGTSAYYSFWQTIIFGVLAALISGTLGGSFLIFYVNERFRDRSYGYNILLVVLSFIAIVVFITTLFGVILAVQRSGESLGNERTWHEFWDYIIDPIHLKNILLWAPVVALTQFALQINDKFGRGVLWSFIRGKYHKPREETRIFMFVDLLSSTQIAEKLGNKKYHNLLRDYFADITNPILFNNGDIYQYVGDEIVISWKMLQGVENSECIQCYFDMLRAIENNREKYERDYDLVPEFKAGMHYGKVCAGEVGIIKRDITYSGDVLNT
ncbi:MAG TPA: adenylate/guanylate cyclase domain-containing protein, partial [Cyclobacteriaceae bacterium]|nr:adenylate/guanylate cyclase domain-containing protein [Cyclobacteriaceae bacterium]